MNAFMPEKSWNKAILGKPGQGMGFNLGNPMNAGELFTATFATPRDPRSEAYKAGALAGMEFILGERSTLKNACPYRLGSAEADAWLSGIEEGKARAQEHNEKRL